MRGILNGCMVRVDNARDPTSSMTMNPGFRAYRKRFPWGLPHAATTPDWWTTFAVDRASLLCSQHESTARHSAPQV